MLVNGWYVNLKIKTKLSLEVILLISLVGLVSFTAVINTEEVQQRFFELSSETMPMLDALKDMRYASEKISSTTMKIILIEDESSSSQIINYEEKLESNFFEIEKSKELFNIAFSKYFTLIENNYPERISNAAQIADSWNKMIISSNDLISEKNRKTSGDEIILLAEKLDNNQALIDNILENTISVSALEINSKHSYYENIQKKSI